MGEKGSYAGSFVVRDTDWNFGDEVDWIYNVPPWAPPFSKVKLFEKITLLQHILNQNLFEKLFQFKH